MIRKILITLLSLIYIFLLTQSQSKEFLLHFLLNHRLNSEKSILIIADTIQSPNHYLWIDVRGPEEYAVSHIPNAILYSDSVKCQNAINSNQYKGIIYYCSIGIRSNAVAAKTSLSYKHQKIYNLYGGIFDWAASGFEMQDASGNITHYLHPYNLLWGWFIRNADIKLK